MELGKVKQSTSELVNAAVKRQKIWMAKMKERGKALAKYLSKHTVKTVQTLVSVTPLVNKLQHNEVSKQNYWKRWGYLFSVAFVLAVIGFGIWAIANLSGCQQKTINADVTEITMVEAEKQTVNTPEATVQTNDKVSQAQQPSSNTDHSEYTVKPGDCLWDIANNILNDPYKYKLLAEYNDISNPDLIHPGQMIKIP